jgi:hypothetical protein
LECWYKVSSEEGRTWGGKVGLRKNCGWEIGKLAVRGRGIKK